MMFLFLMFLLGLILIFKGMEKPAIVVILINLILCGMMFWHHVTTALPIRL